MTGARGQEDADPRGARAAQGPPGCGLGTAASSGLPAPGTELHARAPSPASVSPSLLPCQGFPEDLVPRQQCQHRRQPSAWPEWDRDRGREIAGARVASFCEAHTCPLPVLAANTQAGAGGRGLAAPRSCCTCPFQDESVGASTRLVSWFRSGGTLARLRAGSCTHPRTGRASNPTRAPGHGAGSCHGPAVGTGGASGSARLRLHPTSSATGGSKH